MKSSKEKVEDRLPYEKPLLREIDLVAEEVLGVGCKLDGASATVPDMAICTITACDQEGS